jgi:uncharacterized protein (TIGR01777 family)
MERKRIVIAGGTGFIGSYLKKKFIKEGFSVSIISRKIGDIQWKDSASIIKALNGCDVLINLTGKSVDCRYTFKNKWNILTSRTESTLQLHKLIQACPEPPKLWINSSTATIYRHAEDRAMTEKNGEIGTGFSVHVAESWENAFFSRKTINTKQVALRMAIVLGKGGALKPMLALTKLGFGGKHGNGQQRFSWIHIEDVYQLIRFIMLSDNPSTIYNCSSPNPVKNEELTSLLREKTGMKFGLPLGENMLKFGAVIIQTEAELLLKSRWVIPENLMNEGYEFKFPNLGNALDDLLKK